MTTNPRFRGGGRARPLLALILAASVAFSLAGLSAPGGASPPGAYARGAAAEAVRRRDLVIDLGGGLKTDAQLTLPAAGDGPFPGAILIHGSGNTDMDEYLPPIATGTDQPTVLFLQIAEYLSSRGFAVLRYNKRGVGPNGAIIDAEAWGNMTVQDLVGDAERALAALREQPEVDHTRITIIGHSEGTMIAPRIAAGDPAVTSIVLMGAGAQNLREIIRFQIVDRPVSCAQEYDADHDGLLSIREVEATLSIENANLCPLPPLALIQNTAGEWGWQPGLDADADGLLSIEGELKPLETAAFDLYTSPDPSSPYYWVWLQSHFALKDTALDIIGDVPASILIMQGEGDTQTTVEQAFMLEQRLTEAGHPDHTLATYPGLGHTFYPAHGWVQPLGPMQEGVLADLHAWLTSPERTVRSLEARTTADAATIEALQRQLADQAQLLTEQQEAANASDALITDLQSSLGTYAALTYAALITAAAAIIATILTRAAPHPK